MAVFHYRPKRANRISEVKTEVKKEEKPIVIEEPILPLEEEPKIKKVVRKKPVVEEEINLDFDFND